MAKYLTPGTVTALLSVAAIVAGAFGKTALATFLNDPSTTQTLLTLAGAVGTLIAGILNGVKPVA